MVRHITFSLRLSFKFLLDFVNQSLLIFEKVCSFSNNSQTRRLKLLLTLLKGDLFYKAKEYNTFWKNHTERTLIRLTAKTLTLCSNFEIDITKIELVLWENTQSQNNILIAWGLLNFIKLNRCLITMQS